MGRGRATLQVPRGNFRHRAGGGHKVQLIKPQTYMNRSGECVGQIFSFYQCEPTDLVVIHDDLDLPPFTLRIKTGGGTGGHNGLKSLEAHLGAKAMGYHRVRIGIGKPGQAHAPVEHVLDLIPDEDLDRLPALFEDLGVAVDMILAGQAPEAMNRFNGPSRVE